MVLYSVLILLCENAGQDFTTLNNYARHSYMAATMHINGKWTSASGPQALDELAFTSPGQFCRIS